MKVDLFCFLENYDRPIDTTYRPTTPQRLHYTDNQMEVRNGRLKRIERYVFRGAKNGQSNLLRSLRAKKGGRKNMTEMEEGRRL